MTTKPTSPEAFNQRSTLLEITRYFLRLGCTGFGGPLALVSQMERELGGRWIERDKFAQVFAAIKTMPGPLAFQLAVFLGYQRGKEVGAAVRGAALAGFMLIMPAAVLMVVLAQTRSAWSSWAWTQPFILGLQAAALGLIAASVLPLADAAISRTKSQLIAKWSFALLGFVVTLARPSLEPAVIIFCGILCLSPLRSRIFAITTAALPIGMTITEIHTTLFLTCLKAGALVFGSGIAMVPILGGEFVDRLKWISQSEFLEALMFGQITPGPLVITATYIGYRVASFSGATIATIGVFIVPFIHMTTWFPRVWTKVSNSLRWKEFSFGAISCVIGAVAASVIKLVEPAVLTALEVEQFKIDKTTLTLLIWILFVPSAFMLSVHPKYRKKIPAWAMVLASGALAWLIFQVL